MKKHLRVLCTLLLCMIASVGWGQTTYKLQKVTSVEAGSLYVFEQGGYVMNNTCESSALQTTNSYNTTSLTGNESYVWTLETPESGIDFYMRNISIDKNGYLYNGSSTGVSFSGNKSIWAFNFQTDGSVLIQNTQNSNRFLGYTSSSSHAYKAYAISNLSSYPHAINVYKLVEEGGDTPSLKDNDLALSPTSLEFDLYDDASSKTITFTTSSTGAVTVSESEYVTTSVSGNTITVTPVKKTSAEQTITVSQAADNTYAAGSAIFTISIDDSTPVATSGDWQEVALANLTADDIFIIVGNTGLNNYAMSNDNGTSTPPAAVAVTVSGEYVTSDVADNIKWNISGNTTDGYTFYPNGSTSTWLYCTDGNNGVRVGTNANKTFKVDQGYLKHDGTSRYVGVYNSQDWRCYTSNTQANIADQTFAFYKYVGATVPSIAASNVNIEYSATNGNIAFTVKNEVTGGVLSASTQDTWITLGNETTSPISFTCTANNETTARTATVTLTYTYNTNETVTTEVSVTQAAAPQSYSTIPAIFNAATTTATSVYVTFNNWIVSGVSTNGKNVFVTDNNGNGFVIFDNNGGLNNTYQVGDVLSGTAIACKLVLYNGFAEITNLDANDLTITAGGTVTTSNIAMANLAGVNTGALVSYDNLTCSVNNNKYYLSDGTTTLQVYNALYAFDALDAGNTYKITGVYQQYNNTKEIMPRSAADIVEVVVTSILADDVSITCDATLGEISYTIDNPVTSIQLTAAITGGNEGNWLSLGDVGASSVPFTCSANEATEPRTATVTLTYGEITKNVTVTQAAYVAPGNWVLTSLADLSANDIFVIVGTYNDDGSSFAMSNDNGTNAPSAVSVTIAGNTLSGEIADNLQWNISSTTDGYTFYPNGETEKWLYCTNSNNGVKVGTNDDNIFTLDSETGYLKHSATSRYVGIYDSQDWRCYNNTTGNTANQSFSFYKKVSETPQPQTVEVTIAAAATDGSVNYGTLYYGDMNLTVPDGVTAYTASVSNGNLTLSEVTGAIPAGTGVVLKTNSKLANNTTFLFTEATEGGTVVAGNMLLGTDDAAETTAPEGSTGTYKFYALSLNGKNAENSIGFYYRKNCPNGEAFVNGKNKAYLAVPVSQTGGAKGFAFDDAATAINGVAFGVETNNAAIYNLNGQRVNKAQKGIYIVNGKKVVIR